MDKYGLKYSGGQRKIHPEKKTAENQHFQQFFILFRSPSPFFYRLYADIVKLTLTRFDLASLHRVKRSEYTSSVTSIIS